MGSQLDGRFKAFRIAAATSANLRVVVSSGTDYVAVANGTTDKAIGILQEDVVADGYGTVKMFNETYLVSVTGAPVTRGDVLYRAVTGQLSSTGTITAGILLENVGTSGIIAEVYPVNLV